MGARKIKIDAETWRRVEACAEAAGYAGGEEFVRHVLEREVDRILGPPDGPPEDDEAIRKRLEGLGYLG